MPLKKEEITRKILHIFSGALIPAGIFYIPLYAERVSWLPRTIPGWVYPPVILAVTGVVFLGTEYLRFRFETVQSLFYRFFSFMLRREESHYATGATWIVLSSLICAVLFRNHPHVAAMALSMFIWGDAAAALIGQSIGRIRIRKKTLEGSIACCVLCQLVCFVLYPAVPGLLDAWGGVIPIPLIVAASLTTTVLELVPIKLGSRCTINDNLSVPVITATIMVWLYEVL